MRVFYQILFNNLIATTTTGFVWFALTYWAYLQTSSVLATSLVSGIYLTVNAVTAFWFGSIVDHNKKKTAMLVSSVVTLLMFVLGFLIYFLSDQKDFTYLQSSSLWVLIIVLLFGVLVSNIRNIAVPTLVKLLVEEENRDRANGLTGTVNGIAFAITSVFSGIVLAYGGMFWILMLGIICTGLSLVHLGFLTIPESIITVEEPSASKVDIKGTIAVIQAIPGLFGLIFFATFNNLLGGVFMSLMDAYGLTLVSVQVWGAIWGVLSLGFILGGLIIAKRGLGNNPLRSLFNINFVMWTVCIFFAIQPSILLLAVGLFIWICLVPYVEATEHTIFQKVVPYERLGRVLGVSNSIESAASPITSFMIGPIAQFIFIPFMTTGAGVEMLGSWFGTGQGRGIALVFIITGIIGLIGTFFAIRTKAYSLLSTYFAK